MALCVCKFFSIYLYDTDGLSQAIATVKERLQVEGYGGI